MEQESPKILPEEFRFETEIAKVTIPAQKSNRKLIAIKLTSKTLAKVPETKGVFKPGRLIINFGIIDEEEPDGYVQKFNPPIELWVRYEEEDLLRAQAAGADLRLAYWKEKDGPWILFGEKHDFQLKEDDPPGTGGYGIVKIEDWGDPQVGWGP